MRAYLEKIEKDYLDDFVYISKHPLINMGVEVIDFDGSNLNKFKEISFNKGDICIGSVEACQVFFQELGIKEPSYIGYPEELRKYLLRSIEIVKLKDIKLKEYPYFIKPVNGVKLFTGTLVENKREFETFMKYYPVSEETELYLSEPIDIISEYRCFIHKGVLKGIKHYAGDFTLFPNISDINKMISDYKTSNISYTLDVGITNFGINDGPKSTFLIEVNDFWAIGSYGLDGKTYTRMTIDRFQEILKN